MNIQDWLQGTADADQQSPTGRRDAAPSEAFSANAVIMQRSNSRERRRSTSISCIQPLQAHQKHWYERGEQSRGEQAGDKRSATSYGCSNGASVADESHPYKKRKRRRTRRDRYDVKPAKTQNKSRAKRGEERKKRRMAKGVSGSAIVKDYKAKNVSVSRLTV